MILRSILAAVDFSDESRRALRWGGDLAARYEARLVVVTVLDPLLVEAATIEAGQDLAEATGPVLREFVETAAAGDARSRDKTTTHVRVGQAPDLILQTAEREGAGLIVMGTQGLGGVRKWILGSTVERTLRRTRVPVLAVPLAAGFSIDVHRILVATDFSPGSAAAVSLAMELASVYSAPLIFAHVVEPIPPPPHLTPVAVPSNEERTTAARVRLAALAVEAASSRDHETVVSIGRASDVIASLAADRGASLIVMGLAGQEGPFAPRPGSIASRVLASATVPVLVAPVPARD